MIEVRVRFVDPERSSIHRIHNFGEDLWRALSPDKAVNIDIGEIDRSRDVIRYFVRRRHLKRSLATTDDVLTRNLMKEEAAIEIADRADA